MPSYSNLITDKELLDFSQTFSVVRNRLGSRLFPDRKVEHIKIEYSRLVRNGNLPVSAAVHALDTEARIASRVPFENIETEKLLIKEKINVSESVERVTNGLEMDSVKEYVFDDIARMAEAVVTRAEIAKMDVLTKGKMVIKENGLNFEVDFGLPAENKVTGNWGASANVLSDIRKWYNVAEASGQAPTQAVTSRAVLTDMMANESIQKAIFGTTGAGTLPSLEQINSLLSSQFDGLTLSVNEEKYGTIATNEGKVLVKANRFFPKKKFVMFSTSNDAMGAGIWGVTPEEIAQGGAFTEKRQQQFVTVTQWDTPDPVAHWTKASGMFVPALFNPYGLVIAEVTSPSADSEG